MQELFGKKWQRSTAATTKDGSTILVIEDEESVRSYIAQVLAGNGFRVLVAVDGADGMKVFTQNQDAVQLVLLDLTMPGLDGREVGNALSQLRSDLLIIFMSGYSRPELPRSETHVEKDVFLQKPFRPHELIDLVKQKLVAGHR